MTPWGFSQSTICAPAMGRGGRGMKFNKLRLAGFKSFCEATDFLIEPGLTGVVGPNGCGKSNLVEAMRWVMGENSYKNMRASGMDDVIFSGSGNRAGAQHRGSDAGARQFRPHGPCPFNDPTPRSLAPHRARGGLALSRQRPRGARPRRAIAVRRRLHRRALAGDRAAGPDRRDHQRPSRRRAGAFSKRPPASPACIRAGTRPSCG
jgi:energy-coupling factor transporter ATP-binding protein EcfA2